MCVCVYISSSFHVYIFRERDSEGYGLFWVLLFVYDGVTKAHWPSTTRSACLRLFSPPLSHTNTHIRAQNSSVLINQSHRPHPLASASPEKSYSL